MMSRESTGLNWLMVVDAVEKCSIADVMYE